MSPILLFCFRRMHTLTACIDSLKSCPESINTNLVIISDAGRNVDEQKIVDEIRLYLKNIDGFKSIRIIHREENFGLESNLIRGIKEMAKEFESFIVVEDDLVVSNQFLQFMNAGLSHFKDFDKVLTISAFNYVQIPINYLWDCYFAERFYPWAWATWSHKIKEVDWDLAHKENFLKNSKDKRDFNAWGSDRTRLLRRTLTGEIDTWDVKLDYFQFKKKMFTAYSCKNLVNNIGFNDTKFASNTFGYNRYKTNIFNFKIYNLNFPNLIIQNNIIKKRFISRSNLFNRLITVIFKILKISNH